MTQRGYLILRHPQQGEQTIEKPHGGGLYGLQGVKMALRHIEKHRNYPRSWRQGDRYKVIEVEVTTTTLNTLPELEIQL